MEKNEKGNKKSQVSTCSFSYKCVFKNADLILKGLSGGAFLSTKNVGLVFRWLLRNVFLYISVWRYMFSIFPLAFLCEQLLFCGIFLYGKPQAKESAKHTCNWPRQSPEPDSPEKLYANDATFYPVKYQ